MLPILAGGGGDDAAEQRADAALIELAFVRSAGHGFADLDAAWKLIDKTLIKIYDDGEVNGLGEALDAPLADHPFIATTDDKSSKDKTTPSARRP